MKKKLAYGLILLTAAAVVIWTAAERGQPTDTVCMVAHVETVQKSIQCDGRVEEADAMELTLGKSIVPEKILVKKGDKVYKGRKLMEYVELSPLDSLDNTDRMEAIEAISAMGGISALKDLNGELSIEQLSKLSLSQTKVLTSPTMGIVTKISAAPNMHSGARDTIMVIASSERLQVNLKIPENQISEISIGQRVLITGIGFQNLRYAGVITKIDDRASTGSVENGAIPAVAVTAVILNQDKAIKPGFTATVQIQTGEKLNTIVVPYEAVGADGNGREYVYVVHGGIAKKSYIKTEMELSNGFEVTEGLNNGDQIVLNAESVSNGKRIRPIISPSSEVSYE